MTEMKKCIGLREAAEILNVSYPTAWKLARTRRIPAMKLGGKWRLFPDVLEKWMLSNMTCEN